MMKAFFPKWGLILGALLAGGLAVPAAGQEGYEEKPMWEAGLGVGVVSFPEYRGSSRQRTWLLPMPYVIYRGKILRADRGGLRGMLFDSERVELNLSLSASVPVYSSDKGPRQGMPDLRPTVEFGPSLAFNLWRNEMRNERLDLRLPVRVAYGVTGGFKYAGLIFAPSLNYNTPLFGRSGWGLGASAGPIFANARQHRYFYEVEPRYATLDRPAYSASGGYSGSQFSVMLSKRFEKIWFGGFMRYDTLHGAAFVDSPLVERKNSWMGGLGVAWIFGKSDRTVNFSEND
ncbi:MAG: MipA/OmpV family protein [Betaproteobacteria bacterium]|nr:MipA/OmpV family protein [Betaproteobacteria bacterium]